MLRLQSNILVASLFNNLLFDIVRLCTRLCLDVILRRANKASPGRFREVFGYPYQIRHRADTEDKPNIPLVPAVQIFRLAEVRIAAKSNLSKAGATA